MGKKLIISGRRFYMGFILLLVGSVMILERAGLISWELYDFLLSWKMLLVAIGAFVFVSGNKGAGIIVMAVGAFFMLPDVFDDYEQIKKFFWPVMLLILGVVFMFSPKRKKYRPNANRKASYKANFDYNIDDVKYESEHSKSSNNLSIDYFDEFVIFGGREINMSTQNLEGGRSTAVFGGSEIDLRQCQISPQGCNIDVTTLFGGHVIKVPNNWTVLNKVTTIFGGYSDLRIKDPLYAPDPAKTIVITGVCIFGGTEVRNFDKEI